MKVYVVMGSQGEWSDRNEWSVCVYIDEGKAQECVERLTQHSADLYAVHQLRWDCQQCAYSEDGVPCHGADSSEDGCRLPAPKNELDPRCGEYDEARYWLNDVELVDWPADEEAGGEQ